MPGANVEARVSLIQFTEDDTFITYCPALDLSGYGITTDEANNSFELALEEFFRYTIKKNTLNDVLHSLGWKRKEDAVQPCFNQPDLYSMLGQHEYLNDIFSEKEFTKVDRNIQMPAMATC